MAVGEREPEVVQETWLAVITGIDRFEQRSAPFAPHATIDDEPAVDPARFRQFVEDVTAYLEHALPAEVVARIGGHLADCPHCREYLRQMRRTIAMTGRLSDDDVDAMPEDLRVRLLEAFHEQDE